MIEPTVTVATADARERVVETVVAAFVADPAFHYFFRDGGGFDEQASEFAGYLFDARVAHGTVWTIEGGRSVAMWDGPDRAAGGDRPELRVAPGTSARLAAYESVVHSVMPSEPHWYLGILATHPSYAGRRWGRAVMAPGVASATAADLPAYLETANAANVEVYRRSGWTVTAHVTVGSLDVWVMRFGVSTLGPDSAADR